MKTDMYCYHRSGERVDIPSGNESLEAWLDPDHTAVVCIDMHRSHVGAPGETMPLPVPRAGESVPAHNAFQAACRDLGIPVIMAQHWQRHGGVDDLKSKTLPGGANWRVLERLYGNTDELLDECCWEDTPWVDLMVEDDPERDYYIRTKKRLSAFYPTDLEFLCRQLDVKNLILTGTLTDCCVLNTAYDAANRDFRVILPRDVTRGISEEMEASAHRIIATHLGIVVDGPALLREYTARRGQEIPAELAQAETMADLIQVAA